MKNGDIFIMKILLILWLGFIGADRIDLLARKESFHITPFICISLIILFFQFISIVKLHNSAVLVKGSKKYFFLINIFLVCVLFSVLFAMNIEVALQRFILLAFEIYCTLIVSNIIFVRDDRTSIILKGCYCGIFLFFLMDVLQLLSWIYNLDLGNIIDIIPPSYGSYAPRPSGFSIDPNRGGIILSIYAFFIWFHISSSVRKTWCIGVMLLMVSLTVSRSAIFCFLITIFFLFENKMAFFREAVKIGVALAFIVYLVVSLTDVNQYMSYFDYDTLFTERTSFSSDDSGGEHFLVIMLAIETFTESVKNILVGIGFGNSYLVTDSFFEYSKYGNFHSQYVTIFVECGIVAGLVFIYLTICPLLKVSKFRIVVVSIMIFNVFYQLTLEPIFWFCCALSWLQHENYKPILMSHENVCCRISQFNRR